MTYKLDLPTMAHIHLVFHASLLKQCVREPEQYITPLSLTNFIEHRAESSSNLQDKVLSRKGSIFINQSDDMKEIRANPKDNNNFIMPRRSM